MNWLINICFFILYLFEIKLKNKKNHLNKVDFQRKICIISLKHTLYIAYSLQNKLESQNFEVKVVNNYFQCSSTDMLYIVICPQVFRKLPPANRRICFQLEQYVSTSFTYRYLYILIRSLAIYDYSLDNINYLHSKGIPYEKMHYIPIGYFDNYKDWLEKKYQYSFSNEKKYDILFYGSLESERRRKILKLLSEKVNIEIVSNLYGCELFKKISEAKMVINIHFYDNALLETTRIFECLSLGVPIISEVSADIDSHKILEIAHDNIEFIKYNDFLNVIIKKIKKNHNLNSKDILLNTERVFNENLKKSLEKLNIIS